jgi:dTDP-4-dehydrorhamnose reductase
MREKILVTGGSGLVGSYLAPYLNSKRYDLYLTTHQLPVRVGKNIPIDLSDTQKVLIKVREIRPEIIVNLAAFTDVDGCEIDLNLAELLNRDLVSTLSSYAHESGSYLLHISTDYVFDGRKGNYDEYDEPNPINNYGRTKLQGENAIASNLLKDNWCIARISTPFGIHSKKLSFPSFVIEKLRNNQTIKVLADQFTSPTYTKNVTHMLTEIIERRIKGFIHISGASRLSRFQQALKICDVFNLNKEFILDAMSNEMNWKAHRPKDSSLNVDKACTILSNKPGSYDEMLQQFADDLNSYAH